MKGFNQVSRTIHNEELADPLSMFASMPEPNTTATIKNITVEHAEAFSSSLSEKFAEQKPMTLSTKSLEPSTPEPPLRNENGAPSIVEEETSSRKMEWSDLKIEKDSSLKDIDNLQLLSGEFKVMTIVDSTLQILGAGLFDGIFPFTNYCMLLVRLIENM